MKTCSRCHRKFADTARKCPYCGKQQPHGASGVFQASTVLISAEGAEAVYRSMEDVPDPLRAKLFKSTNSANSATILIADRRGREEIARVMRSLPGTPQRGGVHSLLAAETPSHSTESWWTPERRRLILGLIFLVIAVLLALAILRVR
ncbi:MAG: hypothetical protein JO323_16600 [Acidobacteriia bacterium]|nr:hypothetical protein [Terriglobia bacterium]